MKIALITSTLTALALTALVGCASPKQFLRPLNYHGVEQAKALMEYQGYIPVEGTDRNLFIVKGDDAQLYRNELQEYRVTQSIARTSQLNGESYTLPVIPDAGQYRTITPDDWFARNKRSENAFANVVDTLWNGALVGGSIYAGQELADAFDGSNNKKSSDRTITAGGDVNFIENANVGGSVGSPPEDLVVEGLE